jgi:hypothetical protein
MLNCLFYVILTWTAVGNVGMQGIPAYYDVRYSLNPITEENFEKCIQYPSPDSAEPGTIMHCYVDRLCQQEYYFAVKAVSKSGIKAKISNVVRSVTIPYIKGDPNRDGKVNIGDVIYLINYEFKLKKQPIPLDSGDSNCDGNVSIGDIVYLINYIFHNGPFPCVK